MKMTILMKMMSNHFLKFIDYNYRFIGLGLNG